MKNDSQTPEHGERPERSERPERIERPVRQADVHLPAGTPGGQAQVEALMNVGFAADEAVRLLSFRDHLYSNGEMMQRMANDQRMQFARWLYEQGELREM